MREPCYTHGSERLDPALLDGESKGRLKRAKVLRFRGFPNLLATAYDRIALGLLVDQSESSE